MSHKRLLSNHLRSFSDSYSVRDVRLHLRHVRDLLRSLDPADAYNGVNCSSLSYLSYYTQRATGRVPYADFYPQALSATFTSLLFTSATDSLGSRKAFDKESVDLRPPDYLLPGCKDLPLMPLQPIREDRKVSGSNILN